MLNCYKLIHYNAQQNIIFQHFEYVFMAKKSSNSSCKVRPVEKVTVYANRQAVYVMPSPMPICISLNTTLIVSYRIISFGCYFEGSSCDGWFYIIRNGNHTCWLATIGSMHTTWYNYIVGSLVLLLFVFGRLLIHFFATPFDSFWIYLHLMTQTMSHQAKKKLRAARENARCCFFRLKRLMIFWALYVLKSKMYLIRMINSLVESEIRLRLEWKRKRTLSILCSGWAETRLQIIDC